MRQDRGKHSWPWCKEQIISKWENDSWRFIMENSFEEAIFDIERESPMSLFLKQKDRLTALRPDMSETMVHKTILRKCGGDLEHAIRSRFFDCFSTEDYINAMEDITTRTKIGRKKKEITVIRQVKNFNKAKFVSDQLIEEQNSPELTLEMKEDLIEIFFHFKEAFSSDNHLLGATKVHEVKIMLNVEIPYPPLLRRPAYPSPRAREELEYHINKLMKLVVLRNVGHNEEVEVTTPVIIT
ncbi:hypothetical protein O181_013065 [Austropuccinia psidii MF-1]|uniref:Uncharacterized protein n=1 Tax=Austropuccinia psidii MF-1 TaxID=1389203 RepID=A0A9Q3GNJ4_9BASI|nr:hypothetical protein [Austropuccinia psidii MF-1]